MPRSPRRPVVAGAFYEGDATALAHQIETAFTDPRGPGELPPRQRSSTRRVRAAVVPHAGYIYSGAIAAHAYRLIAADRPPESVLILGVDHYGLSPGASLSDRPWLTPLGPTPVDSDLVAALRHEPVDVNEEAHQREHSIEVQLPFLEYVLPHPKFVPLEVGFGPYEFLRDVAKVVRSAVQDRDVLLISSTDFSHYVPPATAQRLDRMAIDQILASDSRGLYETVTRNDISMCGIAPTTVLLAALEGSGVRPRLLRWGHSGEVEKMRDVVGYAALVFESDEDRSPVK
ncbi:MAG TPA: AmmeMemoRadiSam system protein B [Thermoplasmata archaeon]|nr:AmmeMemoRadiSam system protein B [Thermoplasmata archaeon]HYB78601.1 AmmeMemoRadiSam system protein B [Thermoplasmata archaeon]